MRKFLSDNEYKDDTIASWLGTDRLYAGTIVK